MDQACPQQPCHQGFCWSSWHIVWWVFRAAMYPCLWVQRSRLDRSDCVWFLRFDVVGYSCMFCTLSFLYMSKLETFSSIPCHVNTVLFWRILLFNTACLSLLLLSMIWVDITWHIKKFRNILCPACCMATFLEVIDPMWPWNPNPEQCP